MTTTIKAIDTYYKGYKFRSRLEAKWAIVFDALNVKWQYEKEGFDLGELGYYLPDFWVSDLFGHQGWIEIKSNIPNESTDRIFSVCCALSAADLPAELVTLIIGEPWPNEYSIYVFKEGKIIKQGGEFDPFKLGNFSLSRAFQSARAARFEHGEAPSIDRIFNFLWQEQP